MLNKPREYKISVNDEWVNPEETLIDSSSGHQDIEVPIPNSIFKATLFAVFALSFIVVAFVFDLSVRNYDYFVGMALQNRSVNFPISPPRGIIFDRLGMPLVANEPVFDLLAVSREITETKLCILEKESFSESPLISDLCENKNGHVYKIADILGKNKSDFSSFILDNIKNNAVFFVALNLNKNQVLEIESMNPKGFYIIPNTKRQYLDGSQFSQILGYLSKVNKSELGGYYSPTDIIGRFGIEGQYEEYLRGEHGKIFFQYDDYALNKDPVIGNNVVLNIDYKIQKHLFSELYNVLQNTSRSRAAAIVQDPRTGAVLAMVSLPTYDNNLFIEGLSETQFSNIFENKSRPLFNRVISGLYNPGSAIKPFMGLMVLAENVFSSSDTIQDCIDLTVVNSYNPDDTYTFKNWRPEYGSFNLKRAIANSCNIYFFITGGGYGNIKGLGMERIIKYLKSAFADSKLGIDLPGETRGFVPTPEWKLTAKGENWYQGDTYNVSIGQGDLLVTPLWLNSYISAIANGGVLYKPFLVKQILDNKKNIVRNFEPESLTRLNFEEGVIREIKNAMAETVLSGTAQLLRNLPVKAGAKTGTAEVVKGRTVNSIMTAFAPFDNPEINITVLIEGGISTNEGLAIRTVYEFMKWYFGEYQKQ